MKIFNAIEIIDMGIEKEKKRRDFYTRVAETFEDERIKELFSRLRDWEEAHINKFTQIRERVNEISPVDSYPGELTNYMQALVDDKLYSEVSSQNFNKKVTTPIEAIQYGLSFEKDAIIFFNELLPFVTSPHKDAIQLLINEEKKHIIYLADLRSKLS